MGGGGGALARRAARVDRDSDGAGPQGVLTDAAEDGGWAWGGEGRGRLVLGGLIWVAGDCKHPRESRSGAGTPPHLRVRACPAGTGSDVSGMCLVMRTVVVRDHGP
jgi:hypothetical protein